MYFTVPDTALTLLQKTSQWSIVISCSRCSFSTEKIALNLDLAIFMLKQKQNITKFERSNTFLQQNKSDKNKVE